MDKAKSAQVATSLLTSRNNLLQQVDVRMRLHGLRQLVDDKFVASCQQTCCKMIVQICWAMGLLQLFQQVVTSLQITNCNKPDFNRVKFGKIDNLQQVCGVFGCVRASMHKKDD